MQEQVLGCPASLRCDATRALERRQKYMPQKRAGIACYKVPIIRWDPLDAIYDSEIHKPILQFNAQAMINIAWQSAR